MDQIPIERVAEMGPMISVEDVFIENRSIDYKDGISIFKGLDEVRRGFFASVFFNRDCPGWKKASRDSFVSLGVVISEITNRGFSIFREHEKVEQSGNIQCRSFAHIL